uniref:Uncharacterized protein n=1 Tax=Arion vulgaris TaxID=1028688 RepID=A0A0B7A6K2_9EUPU
MMVQKSTNMKRKKQFKVMKQLKSYRNEKIKTEMIIMLEDLGIDTPMNLYNDIYNTEYTP